MLFFFRIEKTVPQWNNACLSVSMFEIRKKPTKTGK